MPDKKIISLDELSRFKSDYDSHLKTLNGVAMYGGGNYTFDSELNEVSTNAVKNLVIAKDIKEINYELAIIREELFEVLLTELDYKVNYAISYVVPDTLSDSDGTHRLVYSETMLKEIEGNGVALNQQSKLIQPTETQTVNDVVLTPISGLKIKFNGTASSDVATYLNLIAFFNIPAGHKVYASPYKNNNKFTFGFIGLNYAGAIYTLSNSGSIISPEYGVFRARINIASGTSFGNEEYDFPQIFDLTQMFGAGNEPTSTSDNRIQWLLSLIYIPYNIGELKNTTISGLKIGGNVEEMKNLPSQYTQVSYIQSSGTQYIDTNFKPNGNSRMVAKIDMPQIVYTYTNVGGARDGNTKQFHILLDQSGWYWDVRYGSNGKIVYNDFDGTSQPITGMHIFDFNKNVITIDGHSKEFPEETFQSQYNAYVFAVNNAGIVSQQASYKLYEMKWYDNGTLVRDLVPCYRKSDNEIGLYDVVNDTFYTNQGTGTFTKGDDAYLSTIIVPQTTLLGALNSHDTLSVVDGNVVEGEQLYNIVHTTNVGSVDLGTLTWGVYNAEQGSFYTGDLISTIKGNDNDICSSFPKEDSLWYFNNSGGQDKAFNVASSKYLYIRDKNNFVNKTANQVKALLENVYLLYELATPTQTIVAQDLHFDQVSSIIKQGDYIRPIYNDVPPNITTTFVVKKAVGE